MREASAGATYWEARYNSGDTPWIKDNAAPPLQDFLQRHPVTGRVLVPGCGIGHDVRLLAAQGAEVLGLDLAPSAIRKAEAESRAGTERYCLGDFLSPPLEFRAGFDWVFEHTCFCALPLSARTAYVAAVHQVLKPRGCLLAIFYMDPGMGGEGPPFGVEEKELARLFEEKFTLQRDEIPKRAYPGREGRERLRLYVRCS